MPATRSAPLDLLSPGTPAAISAKGSRCVSRPEASHRSCHPDPGCEPSQVRIADAPRRVWCRRPRSPVAHPGRIGRVARTSSAAARSIGPRVLGCALAQAASTARTCRMRVGRVATFVVTRTARRKTRPGPPLRTRWPGVSAGTLWSPGRPSAPARGRPRRGRLPRGTTPLPVRRRDPSVALVLGSAPTFDFDALQRIEVPPAGLSAVLLTFS
jgi:hypothetical protein